MAGLRKPKKKRDASSTNKVLVIFTIFFGLLSIGLGGWTYSVFSQQADLEKKLVDAKKALEPSQSKQEYYEFLALDLLTYYGNDVELHKGDLGETSVNSWKILRDEFFAKDPNGPNRFKEQKSYAKFKELIDRTKAQLDLLRTKGYKADSYESVIAEFERRLSTADAKIQSLTNDYTALNDTYTAYKRDNDAIWAKVTKSITEGNAVALAEARAKSEAHLKSIEKVKELQAVIREAEVSTAALINKKDAEIQVLKIELERTKENMAAPPVPVAAEQKNVRVPHALMLDISRGKPLWDSPVGKITRIDAQANEVYINVGSAQGVKPETTFNIFAPGWKDQKAGGRLKGCIEVMRVIDTNSSLARITCLYDSAGQEIPLNDPTLGRVRRETDNPLKEGDLLFNMVLGLHVAIAGNVNWEGKSLSDDPAEQMSKLQSFMRVLKQQGVVVDAYLDLTEGRLVGEMKPQTRLLITGAMLRNPDGMNEHAKKVNDVITTIRNQAIEAGLFQISADNLQFVTGYRSPRSANDFSASGFRSSTISAAGF